VGILRTFVEEKVILGDLRKEFGKLQRITEGIDMTHPEESGLRCSVKGYKLDSAPHGDSLNIILSRGEIDSDEFTSVRITLCDLITLAMKAAL
jgi:hypothetical protein